MQLSSHSFPSPNTDSSSSSHQLHLGSTPQFQPVWPHFHHLPPNPAAFPAPGQPYPRPHIYPPPTQASFALSDSPVPPHGPPNPPPWPLHTSFHTTPFKSLPDLLRCSLIKPHTPSFYSLSRPPEEAAPRSLYKHLPLSIPVSVLMNHLRPPSLKEPHLSLTPQGLHPACTGHDPRDLELQLLETSVCESSVCPALAPPTLCGLHWGIIKCAHKKASQWAQANTIEAEIVNGIQSSAYLLAFI